MKKGIKLILAVVVLGVLVAAWLGVRNISDSGDEPEDTTTYLFVVETDPAMLTQMEYEVDGAVYTFAYLDGKWINPADEYMPLDQTSVSTVASALTTVACNRFVTSGGASSEEYGLDAPARRITLKYSDGSSVEYYVGDQNKHTSEYYLAVKGSDAVYSVNAALLDYCTNGYDDFLSPDKIATIDANAVDKLVCEASGGTITLEKLTRTETSENEEGETEEITVTYFVLTNEAGEKSELDSETGSAVINGVLSPIVTADADYHVEDSELASYGLDAPVKLTVHYTEELQISTENSSTGTVKTPMQYVITFGFVADAEGGLTAYMRLPDSDMVFCVDVSEFSVMF